jgi:hypothetical protein
LALVLAATTFAGELEGRFGDGLVRLRPWMETYNLAIGGLHLLVLAILLTGALRLAAGPAQRIAVVAFLLAVLAAAGMLVAPRLLGEGPWRPDGREMKVLRVLVFAPGALRTVGCAALVVALFPRRRAAWAILLLLSVDLSLMAWKWTTTPRAVIASVHPFAARPLGVVPWLVASALFFWLLRASRRVYAASP